MLKLLWSLFNPGPDTSDELVAARLELATLRGAIRPWLELDEKDRAEVLKLLSGTAARYAIALEAPTYAAFFDAARDTLSKLAESAK